MESGTRYRLSLKLRVGKRLGTEASELTASVAGKCVTIESETKGGALRDATWLVLSCGGFGGEGEARLFGEALRRAAHMAGLAARVGIDARDPGEDRTMSWVNPEILDFDPVEGRELRLVPDVHGVAVYPDDGRNLVFRGRASGEARANADGFVKALEEALPASGRPLAASPAVRRAVRMVNLAQMNDDAVAKLALSIAAVEGLAEERKWSKRQHAWADSAAAWLEASGAGGDALQEVAERIRQLHGESIRRRVRRLLADNALSELHGDWDELYSDRSRLFHGGGGAGESLGSRMGETELHRLGERATRLCSRIVLAVAKRRGVAVPSCAKLHFGVG